MGKQISVVVSNFIRPATLISLFCELVVSVAKWGSYPYHALSNFYSNPIIHIGIRLVVYLVWLCVLWAIFFKVAVAHPSRESILKGVLISVILPYAAELCVAGLEWSFFPGDLTHGWYSDSFRIFELVWAKIWLGLFIVLYGIWLMAYKLFKSGQK